MRLFDLHSHWGTKHGYVLQTPEDLAQQERTWGSSPTYDTEAQMAEYFRRNNVRTILDFGFTKSMTLDQVRPFHDYAIDTQQRFSDVIFGNWLQIDPRLGFGAVEELQRCIDESNGFIGYCVFAAGKGFPPQRPDLRPFLSTLTRQRHPGAGTGGLHRLGRGHSRRQRRQARSLSP